jgi:hypothetical protein
MLAGQAGEIETGAVVALTHEGDGIVRAGKAAFGAARGIANTMKGCSSRCSSAQRRA